MALDPNRIYTNANLILLDVVEAFSDLSLTPPSRQYVQMGQVAMDCEQLVVEYVGANRLDLATQRNCTPRYDHLFRVWCVRECEPLIESLNFPTPDSLDDRAHDLMKDAYVLLFGYPAVLAENDGCENTAIISLSPYGPAGNIGGSFITVSKTTL